MDEFLRNYRQTTTFHGAKAGKHMNENETLIHSCRVLEYFVSRIPLDLFSTSFLDQGRTFESFVPWSKVAILGINSSNL